MMFFPVVVAAATIVSYGRPARRISRYRLGQHVLVGRRIRQQHFLDAIEFRRGIRDRFATFARDENVHVGARAPSPR